MILYDLTDEHQREKLKDANVIVIKGKDYSKEETKEVYNNIMSHIFSMSKKNIPQEMEEFRDVIQLVV
ncbi:MAG: hypothetical protein IJK18_05550 [Clostridia bacterium]|nr:hypothetical protein [Clostridia bacterium]